MENIPSVYSSIFKITFISKIQRCCMYLSILVYFYMKEKDQIIEPGNFNSRVITFFYKSMVVACIIFSQHFFGSSKLHLALFQSFKLVPERERKDHLDNARIKPGSLAQQANDFTIASRSLESPHQLCIYQLSCQQS